MKYQVKTFKNKIRLVSIPLPVKSVAVEISVDAGSRYETKKNWGISHFVEHMLFKGTKRRPTAHDLAAEVDSFGGVFNAGTGKEQTSFYIKSAADKLSKDLDILVDILTNSKFEQKEIEKEKGVILEEINMREDIPMAKVGEIFDGLLYGETPLGRMILGKKENIIKMKREDFLSYMKRFYRPERMVVSVAGGIIHKAARDAFLASSHLSEVTPARCCEATPRRCDETKQIQPQLKLHYKKTNQTHFCLGVRTFARSHPDRYNLSVLATILGGSMSSRLFEEVREKRGLAYYIRSSVSRFHETGHLVTQAGVPINKIGEAIQIVLKEYRKMANGEWRIANSELKKAREYLKGHLILSLEDSYNVADLFGSSLLLEGKIRTTDEIIKGIEKVTIKDIARVAKKIFLPKNLNLAIIGPYKDESQFDRLLKKF